MLNVNPIDAHVGGRLRQRRFHEGLTVGRLASRVGIASVRLLRFEQGLERIPAALMMRLCVALDVRPGYFFDVASMDERNFTRPATPFPHGFGVTPPPSVISVEERK